MPSATSSSSRYSYHRQRPVEAVIVPDHTHNHVDTSLDSPVHLTSENVIATASNELSKLLLSRPEFNSTLNVGPSYVGGEGSEASSYCRPDEGLISVAVEWTEDRRLPANGSGPGWKGKARGGSLITRVKVHLGPSSNGHDQYNVDTSSQSTPRLYVHPSLLPSFASTPLRALIHPHQPFALTLVILQPVFDSSSDSLGELDPGILDKRTSRDLDLDPMYGDEPCSHDVTPGEANGRITISSDLKATTGVCPPILRQGEIISLKSTTSTSQGRTQNYRLSLLEPVSQGILTRSTIVILSETPYLAPSTHQYDSVWGADGDPDADGLSEGSYSRTHLSLADFDPDAFLSSSLSLSIHRATSSSQEEEDHSLGRRMEDGHQQQSADLAGSYSQSSSTSGSLTPRPGEHGIPSSPPAVLTDLLPDDLDVEEMEAERGARFTPVRASGSGAMGCKDGSDGSGSDDVCWMGVGGLGRAGIFEGDWVLLRASGSGAADKSNRQPGRLVKALAWERLDEPDDDLPANPILLPPSLYRSLLPSASAIDVSSYIVVQPTSFGARAPTLPVARTITLARIATAEGTDKRYERSWLKSLRQYFSSINKEKTVQRKGDQREEGTRRLVRSGDIIAVPVWPGEPLSADEGSPASDGEESDSDEEDDYIDAGQHKTVKATSVAYIIITSLSYDPLVPLEEDFRTSVSSKARAGELGCWVDAGSSAGESGGESTKMVLTGAEKQRVPDRSGDFVWHDIDPAPPAFSSFAATKLRDLLRSTFAKTSLVYALQLSILIKGVRGSGKRSLIRSIADELGYNIVNVECYDIVGDTSAVTSGTLLARLEKAKTCAPSLLVLHHIEALAKKTESTVMGRSPPIVKVIEEVMASARMSTGNAQSQGEAGWPVVVLGTTVDGDALPNELAGCFKQEVEIKAPNESERLSIIQHALGDTLVAPDVDLQHIARQTAALNAGDIAALLYRAHDFSLKRVSAPTLLESDHNPNKINGFAPSLPFSDSKGRSLVDIVRSAQLAGLPLTSTDLNQAISEARSAYSDSIGAPKIPNVSWDDVGGLKSVKKDILDTIQLPLEKPELFGEGLKKRSGILLYGPPGTGKTLLAKAVATSCSLNFLSVKGPELLNMYIGESEANVRRLFQRARDASPCVIFMDELDSVAPKRGNQGDSAGVMDRIVSQLLAELDGMSSSTSGGGGGGQVFVLGATNRPDLLDPALLRPGRFDKMIYLSVPDTNEAQLSVIKALTRKFQFATPATATAAKPAASVSNADADTDTVVRNPDHHSDVNLDIDASLDYDLDRELMGLVEKISFNYTGADLYALCSDAMLNAMTRCANAIDQKIAKLSADRKSTVTRDDRSGGVADGFDQRMGVREITPQYYLSKMANHEEMQVRVSIADFEGALGRLKPSVSEDEMRGYEAVQREFRGYEIGNKDKDKKKEVQEAEDGEGDRYGAGANASVEMNGEKHRNGNGDRNGLTGLLGINGNGKLMHPEATSTATATRTTAKAPTGKGKGKGKEKEKAVSRSQVKVAVDGGEKDGEGEEDEGVD
ncbi:hypothetical protein IAU59_007495 [Kwoniella sp. CBS 9459]